MATLTIPNTIADGDDVEASPLAQNFAAIATFCNTEAIQRDGSVAMTADLTLSDASPAASEDYVDTAVGGVTPTPTGVILGYGGTSAPSGFLLCDGSAVSRTTYADLFALIGTNFGAGNGSTTFELPDMRQGTLAGYHPSQTFWDQIGQSGYGLDAGIGAANPQLVLVTFIIKT